MHGFVDRGLQCMLLATYFRIAEIAIQNPPTYAGPWELCVRLGNFVSPKSACSNVGLEVAGLTPTLLQTSVYNTVHIDLGRSFMVSSPKYRLFISHFDSPEDRPSQILT